MGAAQHHVKPSNPKFYQGQHHHEASGGECVRVAAVQGGGGVSPGQAGKCKGRGVLVAQVYALRATTSVLEGDSGGRALLRAQGALRCLRCTSALAEPSVRRRPRMSRPKRRRACARHSEDPRYSITEPQGRLRSYLSWIERRVKKDGWCWSGRSIVSPQFRKEQVVASCRGPQGSILWWHMCAGSRCQLVKHC